ncbi:MAG: Tex family protein [Desulfocapsaceae bacterium]|jgi:uncharacterized protein|nr:Tex family protein [Desulfocapsaceae bacterium]
MQKEYSTAIAARLKIAPAKVKHVIQLLDDGATIPFIARYRKEVTGSLDEVAILDIKALTEKMKEVDARRNAIVSSLDKNSLLTDTLLAGLNKADSLPELEDLYLPYRPKRKTRAVIARERGLLPLAEQLFRQAGEHISAARYISSENGINTVEDAFSGARDIIAEIISEDSRVRSELRTLFRSKGIIYSRVSAKTKDEALRFKDYFDYQEPVSRIAGHRLLALYRGEKMGFLRLSLRPDDNLALNCLSRRYLKNSPNRKQIELVIEDCYKRLLAPSIENELRRELKAEADREAIEVFSKNLRELLLAPPLGEKNVLALDPGFRTGAKLVCLDSQGQFLHATTIYPTHGKDQQSKAAQTIASLVRKFDIEAIAIGNGTAGRETEQFVRQVDLNSKPVITLVNEDGASIYSASKSARDEFPELDITVRGAVSIGRRLQDPLAELVKIDPQSIGVGQYQHDVDQSALKKSLDQVVASCVNGVGVELNSASVELLSHVSGLGQTLAANIVGWRKENGPFKSRKELLSVPRLGPKVFELAAGFLRIRNGSDPLDASGVHPERYLLVKTIAADLGSTVKTLINSTELRDKIAIENYISKDIGRPTLEDIVAELEKPGRDPRSCFQEFVYAEQIRSMEDLKIGMELPAIITNVTKFGAFADIGIHQDGLIHISQLADRFVRDPAEIVSVRQRVTVRVLEVDPVRKRISLTMKSG